MIYITVKADYNGNPIKDTYSNNIPPSYLSLSEDLKKKIDCWNLDYVKIFSLSPSERLAHQEIIESLDNVGINICRKILNCLGDEVKIQYYSEGKLKFLDFLIN